MLPIARAFRAPPNVFRRFFGVSVSLGGSGGKDFKQLKDFFPQQAIGASVAGPLPENVDHTIGPRWKYHIQTYGCQMNVSDSEVVAGLMDGAGYEMVGTSDDADVLLLNTCAIRDKAEQKVWGRLRSLRSEDQSSKRRRVVGVLGCMAERLKTRLLEDEGLVDVVVGPDAYRDLPRLLDGLRTGDAGAAINTLLSADETYADIAPTRFASNGVSAFVSIMRGCNNMCAFCVVPFTRGRERSRPVDTIVAEVKELERLGYKEVTLLGQNVNSYNDLSCAMPSGQPGRPDVGEYRDGFKSFSKESIKTGGVDFTTLLSTVAAAVPSLRLRFTSPHPKDFPDRLLDVIAGTPNIASSIHMPAQSGSSAVLSGMRRGYSRESYLDLADTIREKIPGVSISSDFISGFCGESEGDHHDTLTLLRHVKYEQAFMFAYSMREKTFAHRRLEDNVPEDVKGRRLREVISAFREGAEERNAVEVGRVHLVLVEGPSRKSSTEVMGRTDTNKVVVFDPAEVDASPGDFVAVRIDEALTHATLRATALGRTDIQQFYSGLRTVMESAGEHLPPYYPAHLAHMYNSCE